MIPEYTKSAGRFLFGSPRKVLAWVVASLIWVIVVWPNVVYPAQMLNRRPQFDALNKELFAAIPTYPNARFVQESVSGHSGAVGRVLTVEFEVEAADEDLFGFYDVELIAEGWSRTPYSQSFARYRRDNACLQITPQPGAYLIDVWHDYANQPSAPWPPPQWLLEMWSFSKVGFWDCR